MKLTNLRLKCEVINGTSVVDLDGSIDFSNCHQVRQVLEALVSRKIFYIVLDARKVSFMDSSGIGLLLEYSKKVRAANGDIFLLDINPALDKVLRVVKAHKFLQLRKGRSQTIEEARSRWATNDPGGAPKKIQRVNPALFGLSKDKAIYVTYNLAEMDKVLESFVITVGFSKFTIGTHKNFTPPEGTLAYIMFPTMQGSCQFVTTVVKVDEKHIFLDFPDALINIEEEEYFKIGQEMDVEFCCIDSLKANRVFKGVIIMLSAGGLVATVPDTSEFIGLLGIKFSIDGELVYTCIGRAVKVNKEMKDKRNITVAFTLMDERERDLIIRHIFRESLKKKSGAQKDSEE